MSSASEDKTLGRDMPRDLDALANVLIALCELEKSVIVSDPTRVKIAALKAEVEQEIAQGKKSAPPDLADRVTLLCARKFNS